MATEKRLIDANALIAYFEEQCDIAQKDTEIESTYVLAALKCCIDLFQNFPTVDAVEVVHGRWVSDEADVLFHCSECETQISTSWDYDDLHWNYCPNCGAKMDK